jgi:Peptidase family M41
VSLRERQLTAIAYHEAGHAVIAWALELSPRLMEASIVPNDVAGTLGHVRLGKLPRVSDVKRGADGRSHRYWRAFDPDSDAPELVRRRLEPEIVVCCAGVIAEQRFRGRRHNWRGAAVDLAAASDFAEYSTSSAQQARLYSAYLWQVAKDLLDRWWPSVETLAEALLERRTMNGRDVIDLLDATIEI